MSFVRDIVDNQRSVSEARDIIQDLERLNNLPENRKNRWVWELIQNAKDVAEQDIPLKIKFCLKDNTLTFQHNGKPFSPEELIALVRKTSTKPLRGEEGNTGKFGTGFISTHVLNKIVNIKGSIKKENRYYPFHLNLDRTFNSITELTKSINSAFAKIDEFLSSDSFETNSILTEYDYILDDFTLDLAKEGLLQLENNLSFTLLINRKIHSIEVKNENANKSLSISIEENVFPGIGFAKVIDDHNSSATGEDEGILFLNNADILIGVHVIKKDAKFKLVRTENCSRIYKEFPLIGTEGFNTQFLIQSSKFQPTEARDGIRTIKPREEFEDNTADSNRTSLKIFVESVKRFCEILFNNDVENLHLLTESGLPFDNNNLLAKDWYINEIQTPLRKFFLQYPLVKTVSGKLIRINEAKFPDINLDNADEFYSLVAKFFPDNVPDKNSFKEWLKIIKQEDQNWPGGINLTIQALLDYISKKQNLNKIEETDISIIDWINDVIKYLNTNDLQHLGNEFAIYPNQMDDFCKRNEVHIDPGIDESFKEITKKISSDLNIYKKLLNKSINQIENVKEFDVKQYYLAFNTVIGNLKIEDATDEQRDAIFKISCFFKDTIAPKRNEWFEILHELSSEHFPQKIIVSGIDDYQWEVVDKWMLKLVCSSISTSQNIIEFAKKYFEENLEKTFQWLNKFIQFVFRNEESKEVGLKYSIILTQDGNFRVYDDKIYAEEDPSKFDDLIKDLYKEYVNDVDPRSFLVDNHISNENLRKTTIEKLTHPIDKLFQDPSSIEKVKEGSEYNDLFHRLNNWFDEHPTLYSLLPIFNSKRSILHLTAFGEGVSKQVLRILKMEKSVDELEELSKIKLSTIELKKLVEAANSVGGAHILIDKAKEILENAEENRWRKLVGTAAEDAFRKAIEEVEPLFQIEQPDRGKDFTIKLTKSEREYYVEIKSTAENKSTVKMTPLQGDTASSEKDKYSLCVITRPKDASLTVEYFIQHSKFNMNIGNIIAEKLSDFKSELNDLDNLETAEIDIALENKSYAINVRKHAWEDALSFDQFITELKKYFNLL